jgi:hypothetical protein
LNQQLTEQRTSLRIQLEEQRNEAAKVRIYAAISDLVAAVELGKAKYREGEVFDEAFLGMESAVARWGLDLDSKELKSELFAWPTFIWSLQREAHIEALRAKNELPPFDEEGAASARLLDASTALTHAATTWPSADEETKALILSTLARKRASIAKRSGAFRAMMAGE